MLQSLIASRVQDWLSQPSCPAASHVQYMRNKAMLREVQVQALQTYLFLLLEGNNQSLTQLWMQGLFAKPHNYVSASSRMPQLAQRRLSTNPAARTWHQLLQTQPPELAQWLEDHVDDVNYEQLTQQLFYGWQNTDYVFSLPMGSGKTWLMAAVMYLNLYLGDLHPGDGRFASNFAVLIPSAKKSSILPSLRSIERFDPAAVIPEPAASQLRMRLKFEVLDAAKTAARSNQIQNPNARKVAQYLADPALNGLVLVVNAEKVILDRMDDTQAELIERSDDDRDRAANELRATIGSTPGLMLLVDEVHGAAHDEIRLRQVIQGWHANGKVHSVLGFSGTPYLDKALSLEFGPHRIKQTQISTVVHHYPLTEAVRTFLKIPDVRTAHGLDAAQIVEQGTEEFLRLYGSTVYGDGCTAKLAIYCGSIERLENEVFPQVQQALQQFGVGQILKYHRGNKEHPAPAGAEAAFAALDSPASPYRIVLLVQIGKEGWDCRSLTGVILAQKGDSPSNMVLQSSCRCLREVQRGQRHKALIYLSSDNAKILEAQLQSTQGTSIAQLNAASSGAAAPRPVHNRMGWLKSQQQLPLIEAWQLRLRSQTLHLEQDAHTQSKLQSALQAARLHSSAHLSTGNFDSLQVRSTNLNTLGEVAEFADWLHQICAESAGSLLHSQLQAWLQQLQEIFAALTEQDPRPHAAAPLRRYQSLAPQAQVRSLIRMAFWPLRRYHSEVEALPESAHMLLLQASGLPVQTEDHSKLYPSAELASRIVQADQQGLRGQAMAQLAESEAARARELLMAQGLGQFAANLPSNQAPAPVLAKDQSFHYVPYDFVQSGFELGLLDELLKFTEFRASGLEIYYNGAKHLTEFRIDCFHQGASGHWQRIGFYTPDFLMLLRHPAGSALAGQVNKVLIVEAKGKGFAEQTDYTRRRDFVQQHFLPMNNTKFDFQRFDFVQIDEPPGQQYAQSAQQLRRHAAQFFGIAC